MKKPQRRAQLALLAAAALTVTALLPGSTAVAKSSLGTQATIQVLASGLNVPRGLVFDGKNKRILVAESGIDAINVTGPCVFCGQGGDEPRPRDGTATAGS